MIIGIIPARGGSKGIPRKNLIQLLNKPLICWTIQSALESKLLDKVYVSSEDKEIQRIARKYGAEVLKRPDELAQDETLIVDVLKYHLENDIPNAKTIVLLQPTSPIRDDELIDFCIKTYKDSTVDSLATGFEVKWEPYGTNTKRRQDYQGWFYDSGSVYIINSNLIRQGKLFNENHLGVFTDQEMNYEIDTLFDLWLCEQILLKREKEKCQQLTQ